MYEIGDKVVHPNHGAGVIEQIKQKSKNSKEKVYVIKVLVGSMTVQIPAGSIDKIGLRPIICCEEADRLLDYIKDIEVTQNENWNKRCRDNMEKLKSGDINEVAYVVKALTQRNRNKALSTGEKKIFNSANAIIASEIALAKDVSYEEAEELINNALEDE